MRLNKILAGTSVAILLTIGFASESDTSAHLRKVSSSPKHRAWLLDRSTTRHMSTLHHKTLIALSRA